MLELGMTQAFQTDRQTTEKLENTQESTFKSNFEGQNQTLTFPAPVSHVAKALGPSDTTINNWCDALAVKGYICKTSKGKITEQGYGFLSDIARAKEEGMGLSEYLETLQTKLVPVTEGMEVTAIAPINAQSAMSTIDKRLAAVQGELGQVNGAISSVLATSNTFNEMALKQAALEGAELGLNRAKIKISAMQQTENQALETLLNEMGLS